MKLCPSCGNQSPIAATFCTGCGTSLPASVGPASGRPVIPMRGAPGAPTGAQSESSSFSTNSLPTSASRPVASQQSANPSSGAPHAGFAGATIGGFAPSPKPKSISAKTVALIVGLLVVAVVGILIATSRDNEAPQRAESNSGEVQPSAGDDYVETENETYVPSNNYSSWDDFPDWYRSNFLGSCVNGSNYDGCICALETMEELFTLDEVLQIEEADSNGEDVSWFYNGIAAQCV